MTQWASWRLQSPATRRFIQLFAQANTRENFKVSVAGPLWAESIGGFLLQGPVTRKAYLWRDVIMSTGPSDKSVVSIEFESRYLRNQSLLSGESLHSLIVRRAGLLWSQQDFEWRWSVPLFKCLIVLEFSFILFDLCLLITFFNFILNYVPIVTFWIFTYHKIWIL